MDIQVFTIDAFTDSPFRGNPAAVCLLAHELNDDLHQEIAAEMNLAETAFITRIGPDDSFTTGSRFGLRWFTPRGEIGLCGHGTLASAAALFRHEENTNPVVVFETRSGDLSVTQQGGGYIMDFPLNPPTKQDPSEFRDLIKAAVGSLPVQDVHLSSSTKKLSIRLADSCDRSVLSSLTVDPVALQSSEMTGKVMEVIVTVKGDRTEPGLLELRRSDPGSADEQPGYDFYYRNFSPWYGIPEDPVTGSDLTVLGCYWSKELGKKKMLAYQCSSRGGQLEMTVRDDGRINIRGHAVTVLQGTITL